MREAFSVAVLDSRVLTEPPNRLQRGGGGRADAKWLSGPWLDEVGDGKRTLVDLDYKKGNRLAIDSGSGTVSFFSPFRFSQFVCSMVAILISTASQRQ